MTKSNTKLTNDCSRPAERGNKKHPRRSKIALRPGLEYLFDYYWHRHLGDKKQYQINERLFSSSWMRQQKTSPTKQNSLEALSWVFGYSCLFYSGYRVFRCYNTNLFFFYIFGIWYLDTNLCRYFDKWSKCVQQKFARSWEWEGKNKPRDRQKCTKKKSYKVEPHFKDTA